MPEGPPDQESLHINAVIRHEQQAYQQLLEEFHPQTARENGPTTYSGNEGDTAVIKQGQTSTCRCTRLLDPQVGGRRVQPVPISKRQSSARRLREGGSSHCLRC